MSKRLLLADDSVTIQKVIGITFANEDYQLDIVDNGDSALEQARAQRPDLILADVYMPGRNGYELCAAIKQDAGLAAVPVMLLTGTFEPFDEDKARQAGADAWISKPFESQQLIDRVEELLARAEISPAAASLEPDAEPVAASAAESWADVAVEEDDLFDLADAEPPADIADDDIWGSVALEEDDLLGEAAADESGGQAFTAPEFGSEEGAISEAPADDDVWGELDDEIFDLEEDDIIDEADLLEEIEPVPVAPGAEPSADFGAEDELLADEGAIETPTAGGWSVPGVELPEFGSDAETIEETEPDTLPEVEPEPLADLEPELIAEVEPEEVVEHAAEPLLDAEADADVDLATEQVFEQPVAEPAVAGGSASRGVILDDAQVDRIVERVAREVVERLAGSLLERVAWEVVPDLAESLIKEEIRRIKANLR